MFKKLIIKTIASAIFLLSATILNAQSLKIGAPQPMTGPDAPFGDKFKKLIQWQ